jgi:hypothetical protein
VRIWIFHGWEDTGSLRVCPSTSGSPCAPCRADDRDSSSGPTPGGSCRWWFRSRFPAAGTPKTLGQLTTLLPFRERMLPASVTKRPSAPFCLAGSTAPSGPYGSRRPWCVGEGEWGGVGRRGSSMGRLWRHRCMCLVGMDGGRFMNGAGRAAPRVNCFSRRGSG